MADRLKPGSSCATCTAWSGGIGDPVGDCRKKAPVLTVGTGSLWPAVKAGEWCEEFAEDGAVVAALAAKLKV